jgi:hypothetical protein
MVLSCDGEGAAGSVQQLCHNLTIVRGARNELPTIQIPNANTGAVTNSYYVL